MGLDQFAVKVALEPPQVDVGHNKRVDYGVAVGLIQYRTRPMGNCKTMLSESIRGRFPCADQVA